MLYELTNFAIDPVTASLLLGAILGIVFGVTAQISRFCLRRSVVADGDEGRAARGVWATALLTALVGTQLAIAAGWIGFADHRFAAPDLPYLAIIIGGLMFGVGMVLTRGCISRLTVLFATGNLRALTVIVVFAVVAHATLKGILAPVRVAAGGATVDLSELTQAFNTVGPYVWGAGLAAGLAFFAWKSSASIRDLALAVVIGALVPLGWVGTGYLLLDDFDPIVFQSLSFTSPWADTIFWTIASTSIPAGFGVGLVGGVLVGSLTSSLVRREFQPLSFTSPEETGRYVLGGSLMGFGGVLAGGCSVGAGLSGVATLNLSAALALVSIIFGAVIANRVLNGQWGAGRASIAPAE